MVNESSNLADFKKYIENLTGIIFQDYEALWIWSIQNSDKFWEYLVDYFQIIYHQKQECIQKGERIFEKTWFPGMTLNYTEHIFRHFNPLKTALFYQSETEKLRAVSWDEMRKKTAAIQTFFKKEGYKKETVSVPFYQTYLRLPIRFLQPMVLEPFGAAVPLNLEN